MPPIRLAIIKACRSSAQIRRRVMFGPQSTSRGTTVKRQLEALYQLSVLDMR
jgi:hypothetical protein